MLDVALFRSHKGGDPRVVRESQRRRQADVALVDAVILADERWRKLQKDLELARAEQQQRKAAASRAAPRRSAAAPPAESSSETPSLQEEQLCAETPPAPPTRAELKAHAATVAAAEGSARGALVELQGLLLQIGNLVHEDAPLSSPAGQVGASLSSQARAAMERDRLVRQRLFAAGLAEAAGGSGVGSSNKAGWR